MEDLDKTKQSGTIVTILLPFSLIVKHKGEKIIHRILTIEELKKINNSQHFLLTGLSNSFKEYIGLDISSYRLDEFVISDESFTVYIRTEDLKELRDTKLNNLGI
jgi:hypothetical protein